MLCYKRSRRTKLQGTWVGCGIWWCSLWSVGVPWTRAPADILTQLINSPTCQEGFEAWGPQGLRGVRGWPLLQLGSPILGQNVNTWDLAASDFMCNIYELMSIYFYFFNWAYSDSEACMTGGGKCFCSSKCLGPLQSKHTTWQNGVLLFKAAQKSCCYKAVREEWSVDM